MQGSHEYCPVCVRIPELFVRVPTAVHYSTKCCVTSHDTSPGLLGTFQASNIGEWYTKKLFRSSSIILPTLNFWWEFPFNVFINVSISNFCVYTFYPLFSFIDIICTPAAVPGNGTVSKQGDVRVLDGNITYACNTGLYLIGNRSASCNVNGVIDDSERSCGGQCAWVTSDVVDRPNFRLSLCRYLPCEWGSWVMVLLG